LESCWSNFSYLDLTLHAFLMIYYRPFTCTTVTNHHINYLILLILQTEPLL
jgi:hypothetical protein